MQALRQKEWRLLLRDPWLMSQTLMQLLYLLPAVFVLWRSFSGGGMTTLLVPVLIMAAGQLGGGLAWTGPVAYLPVGAYALYTQWHPPALRTPWIWPARPPHDLGGAVCAGLVFLAGLAVTTVRGARDPAGE